VTYLECAKGGLEVWGLKTLVGHWGSPPAQKLKLIC